MSEIERPEWAVGKWIWWRLNRESLQSDQQEDDQGFDKGSGIAAVVTVVLLIVGVIMAFALAARAWSS